MKDERCTAVKKRFSKRGFTIVEMLMVIAVLAVLTGIVVTASTSVIRKSRIRRNEALRAALQTGIATYYQQRGYWPPSKSGVLQKWSDDGIDSSRKTDRSDKDVYRTGNIDRLDDDTYDKVMVAIMKSCLNAKGNKIMDLSSFTMIRQESAKHKDNDDNPTGFGKDVRSWSARGKSGGDSAETVKIEEMTLGYATSNGKGRFRRFRIYYNADSDNVVVDYARRQEPANSGNWVDDK